MGRRKSDISTLNVAEKQNTELAKRLDELITDTTALKEYLGVSAQAINQYRLGIARPSLENLCKIADFYNVTTDYLLGRTSIKTIRADIAAAGKVTGLSETAITWLNSEPEEAAELSRLLQSDAFRHMIFHLSEYRTCCEEKRATFAAYKSAYKDAEAGKAEQEENEYLFARSTADLTLFRAQKELFKIGEEIEAEVNDIGKH